MDGVERRQRVFDAFGGLQVTAGEEILHARETPVRRRRRRRLADGRGRGRGGTLAAEGAAIVEARFDGASAAAVEAHSAGIVERVGTGGDVDEADRAHAELCRQRAGDERHAADQVGIENAAEAGDAVGQHDAVDAELHIGVIVADMEKTARRGILRHAGRLQQHLFDRRVGALRQRLDGVVADRVGRGADGGVEVAAALVEGITLRHRLFGRCQRRYHRRGRGLTSRRRVRFRFRSGACDLDLGKLGLRDGRVAKADQDEQRGTAEQIRATN